MTDAGLSDHPVYIEFEQLVLPEQVQKQIAFMNRIYGVYGEELLVVHRSILCVVMEEYLECIWINIGA